MECLPKDRFYYQSNFWVLFSHRKDTIVRPQFKCKLTSFSSCRILLRIQASVNYFDCYNLTNQQILSMFVQDDFKYCELIVIIFELKSLTDGIDHGFEIGVYLKLPQEKVKFFLLWLHCNWRRYLRWSYEGRWNDSINHYPSSHITMAKGQYHIELKKLRCSYEHQG